MGRDDMRSVFIGNLADSARNDDVTDFFKGYGKLTDISLKVTLKRMLTQEREIRTRLSNAAKLVKKYDPSAAAMSSEISQINC